MGITHQYFIIIDTVAARNYACYSREGHWKNTCRGPESTGGSSMSIKHDKGLATTSITTKSLLSLLLSFQYHYTSRFPVNFPAIITLIVQERLPRAIICITDTLWLLQKYHNNGYFKRKTTPSIQSGLRPR